MTVLTFLIAEFNALMKRIDNYYKILDLIIFDI